MIFRRTSLPRALDAFEQAVRTKDADRSESAFADLHRAMSRAADGELTPVGPRLAALLAEVPPGPQAVVAVLTGACVELGADPVACAGPLLRAAAAALGDALAFVDRWTAAGEEDLPDPGSGPTPETLERLGGGRQAARLATGWAGLDEWERAAVAVLSHAAVRAAFPAERAELLTLVERLAEQVDLKCLRYALLVLDEPLIVLDRPTGTGYRLRIGGIGDNFQLHTLLAAALIGGGHLPGRAPSAEEVTACLGTDRTAPRPATTGAFNLVSPHGEWIWNEGTPSDIPPVDGVRLLVLDPPPYDRSWQAGGFFPTMPAELRVEQVLSPAECARWFAHVKESSGHLG